MLTLFSRGNTTANRCKAWHPQREHHESKCEAPPKQACLGLAWPCKKQGDQHCEYGHLKKEMARPNLQTASEFSPVAAPRIAKSIMNVVTQNIRMRAARIHAVQPVHEAQDLRTPSPLPQGLCQLSTNHMWGDAPSELQKLTEKGNLQTRHPLRPVLQIPRAKGAPDVVYLSFLSHLAWHTPFTLHPSTSIACEPRDGHTSYIILLYPARQTSGNRCTAWHELRAQFWATCDMWALPDRHLLRKPCSPKTQGITSPSMRNFFSGFS